MEEIFRVAPPGAEEISREPLMETRHQEDDREQVETTAETSPSISAARPEKILVADDNEVTRRILHNVLEAENYLVLSAEDGLQALRLATLEKPDLILTDYLMPKMDGISLIEKLKSQLSTRYIPIIVLTAKDEVDIEVKAIDAGADDLLTKPVNPRRLLARVHHLIQRAGPDPAGIHERGRSVEP